MLEIHVCKNGAPVKTYTATAYDLTFGTVEDILDIIQADDLTAGTGAEARATVVQLLLKSRETAKALAMDIFPGLTEDELRGVPVAELADVLLSVIEYAAQQIGLVRKN